MQKMVAASSNGNFAEDSHAEFWRVWNDNLPFLEGVSMRMMKGNASEAHDLLQEGLFKALDAHRKSSISTKSNPRAYLVKVLSSCRAELYRSLKRSPIVTLAPDVLANFQGKATDPNPEQQLGQEEVQDRIREAIETLPEKMRFVAEMRIYDGLRHQDIAQLLGISAANSRKRWSGARSRLLEFLTQEQTPRAPRLPDAPAAGPRDHRHADDQLRLPRFEAGPPRRHASLVTVSLPNERQTEQVIFRSHRPTRLAQQIEATRNYIARHPGGWKKRRELAYLLEATGDWRGAIEQSKAALERHPASLDLFEALARWQFVHGQTENAQRTLQRALDQTQDLGWQHHFQARLLFSQDRIPNALHFADLAHRFMPGEPRHRCLLAELYLVNGDAGLALDLLWGQHRLCPADRGEAHWLLIALNTLHEDPSELLPSLESRFPDDALILFQRFLLSLKQSPLPDLRPLLRKLRNLAPHSTVYYRARLHWLIRQDQPTKAKRELEHLRENYPNHREMLQLVEWGNQQLGNHSESPVVQPPSALEFPSL